MKQVYSIGFSIILLLAFHFICGVHTNTATPWDYALLICGYGLVICHIWRLLRAKNM